MLPTAGILLKQLSWMVSQQKRCKEQIILVNSNSLAKLISRKSLIFTVQKQPQHNRSKENKHKTL
jgi:hypothetical protein